MQTRPDVVLRAVLAAFVVAVAPASVIGQPAPASAQNPPAPPPVQPAPAPAGQPAPAAQPARTDQPAPAVPASQAAPIVEARGGGPTRRLTIDDAVKTALEQNLDVQVARIDPQVAQLTVDQSRGVWLPQLSGSTRFTSSSQPPNSFLSGAEDTLTSRTFFGTLGIDQLLPKFGTGYTIGWDASRQTTNNTFSSFNPSLASSFSFDITQPLLRGFRIDGNRANFLVSKKNQEITDVQLQQQIIATSRAVRIAYWNLVGARYALGVSQASLDIARQTLRDNRTRVEVGTMAPIDVVQAEAEVSRNEEATIVAAALIDQTEDNLRELIYDPKDPDFWTANLELTDAPQLPSSKADVDIEAAVNRALGNRTDLVAARKQLEATQINLDYYKDQTKPAVNAVASYGLNAQGGVQIERAPVDPNDPTAPRPPGSSIERPFGTVLGDLFGFDFPTWTVGVQVAIPLGNSTQKVQYARNKLLYQQQEMTLRSRELGVSSEVRTAGRNVNTNRKRVDSTTAARVFSERQLDAAQKKFAVGLAQSIDVLVAQRDLASARYSELSAIIDYVKSVVEFQAVQEGSVGANLGVGAVTGVPGAGR
jgi:HAE1 family hydrophobic/amphiphilic exporter-1